MRSRNRDEVVPLTSCLCFFKQLIIGFALNVDPNLDFFDTSLIIPCGIEGREVTSIGRILEERGCADKVKVPTVDEVSKIVTLCFQDVFGVATKPDAPLI